MRTFAIVALTTTALTAAPAISQEAPTADPFASTAQLAIPGLLITLGSAALVGTIFLGGGSVGGGDGGGDAAASASPVSAASGTGSK